MTAKKTNENVILVKGCALHTFSQQRNTWGNFGCGLRLKLCLIPHQAVCCDDHIHCCPQGTICNLEAETCDSQTASWPPIGWVAKVAPLSTSAARLTDEKCDKQTRCPVGTTCCKKDSGLWACCPLPQVCPLLAEVKTL